MATLVIVTTTPRKQGTTTVKQYPTLMAARAAVMQMSDRNLTSAELAEWKKQVK